MRRIEILTTTCRKCGKTIATLSRSLFGADQAKAIGPICSSCVTEEEKYEIRRIQGEAWLR